MLYGIRQRGVWPASARWFGHRECVGMSPPVLVLSGAARWWWCVMTCDARFMQEKEPSALGAPCACVVTTRSRTNESYSVYTVSGAARPRDVEDLILPMWTLVTAGGRPLWWWCSV